MELQASRLGEVLDVQSGFAFKRERFSELEGLPLIRIRDLAGTTTETKYEGPYREEFLVEPGDYLIGMDGEFRCHIWRGPRALLNQRVCRLRSFRESVYPPYIYYGIQKYLKDIEDHTSFATVKHISSRQVENIVMPIPSLTEQRRVVELLTRAESIVRMRREAEAKAKDIIPALFVDMFGDPGNTDSNGSSGGRREAGSFCQLGEAADVVSGVAKGRKLKGKVTREVPYLRVANVQAGALDLSEMKYIPATEAEIDELAVRAGDVLLTEGGDFDKVGRGALLEADIGECIHQNHVFRVRVHPGKLVPEYFAAFLQTDAARQYFLKAAKKTSNLASINMTQLKNLPLATPDFRRQAAFRERFQTCRSLEKQQSKAAGIAEGSFQALLAGVFGEGR